MRAAGIEANESGLNRAESGAEGAAARASGHRHKTGVNVPVVSSADCIGRRGACASAVGDRLRKRDKSIGSMTWIDAVGFVFRWMDGAWRFGGVLARGVT